MLATLQRDSEQARPPVAMRLAWPQHLLHMELSPASLCFAGTGGIPLLSPCRGRCCNRDRQDAEGHSKAAGLAGEAPESWLCPSPWRGSEHREGPVQGGAQRGQEAVCLCGTNTPGPAVGHVCRRHPLWTPRGPPPWRLRKSTPVGKCVPISRVNSREQQINPFHPAESGQTCPFPNTEHPSSRNTCVNSESHTGFPPDMSGDQMLGYPCCQNYVLVNTNSVTQSSGSLTERAPAP